MVGTRGKKIDILGLLRSTDKAHTAKKSPVKSPPAHVLSKQSKGRSKCAGKAPQVHSQDPAVRSKSPRSSGRSNSKAPATKSNVADSTPRRSKHGSSLTKRSKSADVEAVNTIDYDLDDGSDYDPSDHDPSDHPSDHPSEVPVKKARGRPRKSVALVTDASDQSTEPVSHSDKKKLTGAKGGNNLVKTDTPVKVKTDSPVKVKTLTPTNVQKPERSDHKIVKKDDKGMTSISLTSPDNSPVSSNAPVREVAGGSKLHSKPSFNAHPAQRGRPRKVIPGREESQSATNVILVKSLGNQSGKLLVGKSLGKSPVADPKVHVEYKIRLYTNSPLKRGRPRKVTPIKQSLDSTECQSNPRSSNQRSVDSPDYDAKNVVCKRKRSSDVNQSEIDRDRDSKTDLGRPRNVNKRSRACEGDISIMANESTGRTEIRQMPGNKPEVLKIRYEIPGNQTGSMNYAKQQHQTVSEKIIHQAEGNQRMKANPDQRATTRITHQIQEKVRRTLDSDSTDGTVSDKNPVSLDKAASNVIKLINTAEKITKSIPRCDPTIYGMIGKSPQRDGQDNMPTFTFDKQTPRPIPAVNIHWSKSTKNQVESKVIKPLENLGEGSADDDVSLVDNIDKTTSVAEGEEVTVTEVPDVISVSHNSEVQDLISASSNVEVQDIISVSHEDAAALQIYDSTHVIDITPQVENEECESEVNADNQVILVIPADIDDADVERFIADNMTSVPPSYTIKRESVADDTMNGLDVLVQIAVEDEQMHKQQLETSNTNVFDQMPVTFPHVSIRSEPFAMKICQSECRCTYYHCELCRPELVGAFSKSVMRIHYEYHKKKGIQYGDYNIYICQLSCDSEPHLHCPLCGDIVQYINKSVSIFLTHLAGCRDVQLNQIRTFQDEFIEQVNGYSRGVATPQRASILIPHPSILCVGDELHEMKCSPLNGCGCAFTHCPLCRIDKQQFRYECKAIKHFDFHMNHSVEFNGYRILICLLSCCVYSHYHCPLCGTTFQRKCDIKTHVTKRCKGPYRKRKQKTCMINQTLVKMYGGQENYSSSYLKRISDDEAAGTIAMCHTNTRILDTEQIKHPHLSIIHKDTVIHPTLCQDNNHTCSCQHPYCLLCAERMRAAACMCGKYHCLLCPPVKLTANRIQRAHDHIHSHYKRGVPFKDHIVLSCGLLECVPEKRHGFHYHCPQCGIITFLSECFRRHLYSGCQIKDTFFRFVERDDETDGKKNSDDSPADIHIDDGPAEKHMDNDPADIHMDTSAGHEPLNDIPTNISTQEEEKSVCSVLNIKKEVQSNLSADIDKPVGVKPTSKRKLISLKAVKREVITRALVPPTPPRKQVQCDIDEALPSTHTDTAILKSQNTGQEVTTTSQVLQCVSADLKDDLLRQACPSSPGKLLVMLEEHTGIQTLQPSCGGIHRVQGSWKSLEKASSLILKLIEHSFSTQDQVFQYIQENTNSEEQPRVPEEEPKFPEEELKLQEDLKPEANPQEGYYSHNDVPRNEMSVLVKDPAVIEEPEPYWEEVQNLDKYLLKKNLSLSVRCTSCHKRLASMNNLIIHWISKPWCLRDIQTENLPRSYGEVKEAVESISEPVCPRCDKKFVGLVSCISHYVRSVCVRDDQHERMRTFGIFKDTVSSVYCCPKCPYTSLGKRHAVSHYEKVHMTKSFPCCGYDCKMKFATQEALDRHVEIIHINPFHNKVSCELCGMALKRSSVVHHMLSKHSDVRQLPQLGCEQCSFSSWSKTNLRLHVINKHGSRDHQCMECERSFGQMNKLTQHVNHVHRKMRRYQSNSERTMAQCEVCHAVMIKKNLTRHMKTKHVRDEKFPCHGCDKIFYNKKLRWLHAQCHLTDSNNERLYRFRCSVCKKGFNRRWWYLEHIQNAHTDRKQFHCVQCDKSFRIKLLLQRHMLTHGGTSGECKLCKNVFSSAKALRVHMATRHSSKGVVTCPCGIQFKSLLEYRDHLLTCDSRNDTPAYNINVPDLRAREESQATVDTEQLLSDGVEYETEVIEISGALGEEITFGHLEAAQTLESISINTADNVITMDVGHPDNQVIVVGESEENPDNQIIVYTEGDILSLDPDDIDSGEILENNEASHEEHAEPESRTVVMDTDHQGRVFLTTSDGQPLSDEESRLILSRMQVGQEGVDIEGIQVGMDTEGEQQGVDTIGVLDDVDTDGVLVHSEDPETSHMTPDEGLGAGHSYMCGECSVVLNSLVDMERHVTELHGTDIISLDTDYTS